VATSAETLGRLSSLVEQASRSPETQEVSFVWETWERHLSSAPAVDIAQIRSSVPRDTITRSDLKHLAIDADDRTLFVATMIWGRGKKNARMLPGIMRALKSPDLLASLSATRGYAQRGNCLDAYSAWSLPGLGPAFFTKWLWASSYPCIPRFRPLVLDSLVWRSLGALEWDSRHAAGTTRRAARYAAYVEQVHDWADELSTTEHTIDAEALEYALFTAGKR
jgi:hypothetical protein